VVDAIPVAGEDVLIAAVSDGAGSAARSAEGAQLVCEAFRRIMTTSLYSGNLLPMTEDRLRNVFQQVTASLRAHADAQGISVADFACTLLGAIVWREQIGCVQVGDGAIVAGLRGKYEPVFWPQAGEYLNTTNFLTDPSALKRVEVAVRQEAIEDLALFSDGLELLALHYGTRTAHAPFFQPMFSRLRQETAAGFSTVVSGLLSDYLRSALISDRTDDDKTLVLVAREVLPAHDPPEVVPA